MKTNLSKRYIASLAILVSLSATILGEFAQASPSCSASFASFAAAAKSEPALHPKLIRGVVEIEGQTLIEPHLFDEFQIDEIGRAIVERVRQQEQNFAEEIANDKHRPVDLDRETDIILFFWNRDLESIKEKGFLNQHESGKSKGTYDPSSRLLAEDNFTGIKLGNGPQSLKLRPKSAFLNLRSKVDLAKKYSTVTGQYGNIGAVMKPEVKRRSLWTETDSLGLGLPRFGYGSGYMGRELIPHRGTFYRDRFPCVSRCSAYNEALIYGTIGFNEVDYFLVTERHLAESLKQFGRPVYVIVYQDRNNRQVFEKGDLLFSGGTFALPAAEEKSTISLTSAPAAAKKLADPLEGMLTMSGITAKVIRAERALISRDELELTKAETESGSYYIHTPGKKPALFAEYASELHVSLSALASKGILTRKSIHVTDQFLVQEAIASDVEVSGLHLHSRHLALSSLKDLLTKLVDRRVYLKGLRPTSLVLDTSNRAVIRTHEGLREKDTQFEVAERYKEKLPAYWKKFLNEAAMKDLENHLEWLVQRHKAKAAS